jgi:hypothetical protein
MSLIPLDQLALTAVIIRGSIWPVAPVEEVPEVDLERWQIYDVADVGASPELHLSGWNTRSREGRASSKVIALDMIKMVAMTSSGRAYRLVGPPGHDGDAMYVFGRWCAINNVLHPRDVTKDVYASCGDAGAQIVTQLSTQASTQLSTQPGEEPGATPLTPP